MLEPVDGEPLLLRRRLEEALEVAARMQRLSAPVRGRQKRHLHPGPVRKHRLVVSVVHGMGEIGLSEIDTIAPLRLIGKSFRTRYPVAHRPASVSLAASTG